MAVPILSRSESKLTLGAPAVAVRGKYPLPTAAGRHYDVSRDGQKFLLIKDADTTGTAKPQIAVALNWMEELKQRVPAR
jgi:hypothetical protein